MDTWCSRTWRALEPSGRSLRGRRQSQTGPKQEPESAIATALSYMSSSIALRVHHDVDCVPPPRPPNQNMLLSIFMRYRSSENRLSIVS